MEYEAVFWDIGGVLVDLKSVRMGYATFVEELAANHGFDKEAALDTWQVALGEYFRERDGTEYRTAREGYRKATSALFKGTNMDPPDRWRERFDRCLTNSIRAEPGAIETIHTLDEAGLYLGVISDIDEPEAYTMLDQFDIQDCFDDVTTSEAVGFTKPDSRMFDTAIDKAGIDPAYGLMVGDRYRHDIQGGDDCGLDTVAYGEDAIGPAADYQVESLPEIVSIVGVEHER